VEKEDNESSPKPPTPTSWSNQTVASDETLVVSGVEKDDHKMSADSPKPPSVSNPVAASDETFAALNKLKSLRPKRPMKTTMNGGMCGDQKHERVDGDEDNDIDPDDTNDNNGASTKSLLVEVGTKVMKSFGTHGEYTGIVLKLLTSNQTFYRVQYEDIDEEDMEEDELRSVLE
jgi:hypothetical protein